MRRLLSFLFVVILVALTSCADGDPDCDHRYVDDYPSSAVKAYTIVLHKDIPSDRVDLIVDAAFEWVTASQGAVVFNVTYGEFGYIGGEKPSPPSGDMQIYTEPNHTPGSNTIGVCWSWGKDPTGKPNRSRVWIQSDLAPRTYYLTAMHEIGHGLGLKHHEEKDPPSIMYPFITDVGDHPTCYDRQQLCAIWGCAPGC
jgi:hypothetical protein